MNTVFGVNFRPDQGNKGEGNKGDELELGKFCVKIFCLTEEGTGGNKMKHCLCVNFRQSSSISSRLVNRGEGNRALNSGKESFFTRKKVTVAWSEKQVLIGFHKTEVQPQFLVGPC